MFCQSIPFTSLTYWEFLKLVFKGTACYVITVVDCRATYRTFQPQPSKFFPYISLKFLIFFPNKTCSEKVSYNFSKKAFLIFGKRNFLIFRERYIQNPGIFRTLEYSEPEAYLEHYQTSTMERFAKIAT